MERLVVVEPSQHVDGVFVVYPDRERVRDCRGATGGRGASPPKTRGANGARDETRRTQARKQARRSGSEPALAGVPAARGVLASALVVLSTFGGFEFSDRLPPAYAGIINSGDFHGGL